MTRYSIFVLKVSLNTDQCSMMVLCIAAITEACSELIDAGLLPSLMKLLSTTFDVKKEVCHCI